ncbi:frizzled-3 [Anopheles bellator]|uniref:frizzled-3 n=1 Tax=Anopheles bellator TaxID=139047 RepID=UPI00264963B0|nr:frizzled-3 [Anopheles bellator]
MLARRQQERQEAAASSVSVIVMVVTIGFCVAAADAEELRCERIVVGACQNLVYDMTVASAPLYKTFGASVHENGSSVGGSSILTALDAELLINSLRPVIDTGCSKQALFLFCSSLFPLCSPNAPRPVHPCRSLCEQVRRECFSDPANGKLWPTYLDCRTLPQPEKQELCMQVPPDATGSVEHGAFHGTLVTTAVSTSAPLPLSAAPPPTQQVLEVGPMKSWSIENLTSLLRQPQPLYHPDGDASLTSGGALGAVDAVSSKGVNGVSGMPHQLWPGDGSLVIPWMDERGGTSVDSSGARASGHEPRAPCPANYSLEYDRCVPRCGPSIDALYSQQQKDLIEWWTLVLSAICFVFTLMSLVTFWARANGRLDYPDRPILFMTLCYNLLGLCHLERTILHGGGGDRGAEQPLMLTVPGNAFEGSSSVGAVDASRSDCTITTSQCLAYYIIKHYLVLSATTWWLIFALCWYLSTAKQWSCEALERRSGLFHVLAWVVPFAFPIVALLRGNIQRFELTGFCTGANGFVEELATLLLLLIGALLLVLALFALARLRAGWNQRAHLSRVFAHVLTFGVCYMAPATAATVCRMLERIDNVLEPCQPADSGAAAPLPCPQTVAHFSSLPTFLRLTFTLLGGACVCIWLWLRHSTELATGPKEVASYGYGFQDGALLKCASVAPSAGVGRLKDALTDTNDRPSLSNSLSAPPAHTLHSARGGVGCGLRSITSSTGNHRSGRISGSAAKAHKYCFVYQPTMTGAIAMDMLQGSVYHSSATDGSGTPGATLYRTIPTRSTLSSGYVGRTSSRRSIRPVGPLSMITRI